jgi:hypothetical protein
MAHYRFARSLREVTSAALTYCKARRRHDRAFARSEQSRAVLDLAHRLDERLPPQHRMLEQAQEQHEQHRSELSEAQGWLGNAVDALCDAAGGETLAVLSLVDRAVVGGPLSHDELVASLRQNIEASSSMGHR